MVRLNEKQTREHRQGRGADISGLGPEADLSKRSKPLLPSLALAHFTLASGISSFHKP